MGIVKFISAIFNSVCHIDLAFRIGCRSNLTSLLFYGTEVLQLVTKRTILYSDFVFIVINFTYNECIKIRIVSSPLFSSAISSFVHVMFQRSNRLGEGKVQLWYIIVLL